MNSIKIAVEIGKKKIFAGAIDWPGWCRSGKDQATALQALFEYGPRYEQVLRKLEFGFKVPTATSDFAVVERHAGNSTTDFGAPAAVLEADEDLLDRQEFEHLSAILRACWAAFDSAVQQAQGRDLLKGPRGGGRELDKLIDHVIEADRGYLTRVAWKHKRETGNKPDEDLNQTRQAILDALEVAVTQGLPEHGPRGGVIWPARYFIRRVAWHVLDHAWEIEDRIL
jgi:hypothetical protein